MSSLYTHLKQRSALIKLSKSSLQNSLLGHSPLFLENTRFIDWSLALSCFDLSSESAFKNSLLTRQKQFQLESQKAMQSLKERESEEMDDPLATNTVISFEIEAKHQIAVALERTEFFVPNFDQKQSQEFCFRILFRWSMHNKKLGYRQGMNEILSILMKIVCDFDLQKCFGKENKNLNNQAGKDAGSEKDDALLEKGGKKDELVSTDCVFGQLVLELDTQDEQIGKVFDDKTFLCALLFDRMFENGVQDFYNFESKGVRKIDLFLHQTVHKIFKKRLKV